MLPLMARLDRLGSVKEVAQIGAAIGREFSHACWLPWFASLRPNSNLHSTALSRQVCCFGRARHRTRPTCSSMRWYRTRLTARCCANSDARCMPVSAKPLRASSRDHREPTRTGRTSLHRGGADRESRRLYGARRDSGRWNARRWLKQRRSSAEPWTRSQRCPARPRCVASRSSSRSRS